MMIKHAHTYYGLSSIEIIMMHQASIMMLTITVHANPNRSYKIINMISLNKSPQVNIHKSWLNIFSVELDELEDEHYRDIYAIGTHTVMRCHLTPLQPILASRRIDSCSVDSKNSPKSLKNCSCLASILTHYSSNVDIRRYFP
eukprot:sb/3474066/